MNAWGLALVVGALAATALAFCWVAFSLKPAKKEDAKYGEAAEKDVEHIFNDEFREELRNRGRLHFEKIIGENAMFLQHDLRLTTSQVNEYMQQEINKTLQESFAKYEQSIDDAKQLAIESIKQTQKAIEEERQVLRNQLAAEIKAERDRLIGRFKDNMAEIINHHVLDAIGNEIDLDDQLEYILHELEANKELIAEDIKSGA